MADFNAFTPTDPDVRFGGVVVNPAIGTLLDGGAVTTYYFRRTDGTRGNTTALASIPAGAVVERIVTA